MKKYFLPTLIVLFIFSLAGCASMSTEEQQGTAGGAAVGAVTGGLLGGVIGSRSGNKSTGATIGAVAGGVLGAIIGQRMNRQKEELEQVQGVEEVTYDEKQQTIDATLRVLFDFDKDVVKPSEAIKLDQLASVFINYPENIVVLEGHTDNVGTEEYNQDLSIRRAAAIEAYLRAKNLGIASLGSTGYGELRPIVSNATAEGQAQNRRVEINISVDPNRVPQPSQ